MLSIIGNVLGLLKTFLEKITAKDILYFLIIGLLGWLLWTSYTSKEALKERYENNIEAFTDSVSYYKSKTGDMVAMKTAFETNIKELENLNESLYSEIKDLKAKNDVLSGMHFNGSIENSSKDTVFIVTNDTINNGFKHNFNFNDEWRDLEGYVHYVPDSLKVNVIKDVTRFDYTVAIDEDNKIYIKSKNPYVKFNEFTGFTIPKPKDKFVLSIFGELTYDFKNTKVLPIIGLDGSYKQFNGFYEYDIVNNNHFIGAGYKFSIVKF